MNSMEGILGKCSMRITKSGAQLLIGIVISGLIESQPDIFICGWEGDTYDCKEISTNPKPNYDLLFNKIDVTLPEDQDLVDYEDE